MKKCINVFKTTPLLFLAFEVLATVAAADLNLTQELTELATTASELSGLVGRRNPSGNGYERFQFFRVEPDAAIVAKTQGRCFGIFRFTTANRADGEQNSKDGTELACHNDGDAIPEDDCCLVRLGWWEAYNAPFRDDFEIALRDCASTCENEDECVVLGGFSQGGAIAAIASIYLADLNPSVMLFGQPPTMYPNCTAIDSSRWYNFVNTGIVKGILGFFIRRVVYDWASFFANNRGEAHFGHMIFLSDDDTGVAYLGLDAREDFYATSGFIANAHRLRKGLFSNILGYTDRLENLLGNYGDGGLPYPIRDTGYSAGTYCSKDIECESRNCEGGSRRRRGKCV